MSPNNLWPLHTLWCCTIYEVLPSLALRFITLTYNAFQTELGWPQKTLVHQSNKVPLLTKLYLLCRPTVSFIHQCLQTNAEETPTHTVHILTYLISSCFSHHHTTTVHPTCNDKLPPHVTLLVPQFSLSEYIYIYIMYIHKNNQLYPCIFTRKSNILIHNATVKYCFNTWNSFQPPLCISDLVI